MTRLFVDHLTVIDCAYLHTQRGILGESWLVDIELHGALDDQGMVLDFADVKRAIKRTIDEAVDHKLLIPSRAPGLSCTTEQGAHKLHFDRTLSGEIHHTAPLEAVCEIDCEEITPEAVEKHLKPIIQATLPDNVLDLSLILSQEAINGPYYHYAHGLKHHDGNCQRIAHGHRSRIEIHRNGQRSVDLERRWSNLWKDIYIATAEDEVGRELRGDIEYARFAYTAPQGDFNVCLPAAQCYVIETDSTVEYLAEHIAAMLKRDEPDAHFRVKAYEGVQKGAIAEV